MEKIVTLEENRHEFFISYSLYFIPYLLFLARLFLFLWILLFLPFPCILCVADNTCA